MSQVLQPGTGNITGTPNNVTGVDQTVTYTITPTSGAGCVGNTFTATVIVRSEPVGVSTPSTQTVCSDEAITAIVLTTSNGMTAGTTYSWTRDKLVEVTGLAKRNNRYHRYPEQCHRSRPDSNIYYYSDQWSRLRR